MTDAEEAALIEELIETMPDSPNAEVEPLSCFGSKDGKRSDVPGMLNLRVSIPLSCAELRFAWCCTPS